jgi:hypothetical protein
MYMTDWANLNLKLEIILNNIGGFASHFTVNTLLTHYKYLSVNTV